jgi:hypothetical protein
MMRTQFGKSTKAGMIHARRSQTTKDLRGQLHAIAGVLTIGFLGTALRAMKQHGGRKAGTGSAMMHGPPAVEGPML